jgi:hypothetical protein
MLISNINLPRKWEGIELVSSLRIGTSSKNPAGVVTNPLVRLNVQNLLKSPVAVSQMSSNSNTWSQSASLKMQNNLKEPFVSVLN